MASWRLVLATMVTACVVACSSDDNGGEAPPADSGVDAGETDPDAGFVDSGPGPDMGFRDTGPRDDEYCAENDEVTVAGVGVPIDPGTRVPRTAFGNASFSCIDAPIPEASFVDNFCITQCLDFLGYAPTAAEVAALEFHAFPLTLNDQPVDPSFDYDTYVDRQPGARLPIGARTVEVPTTECDSGFKLEMGFTNLGAETFVSERFYVVRVRSSQASGAFPTTYLYRYIRRNDQGLNTQECQQDQQRVPQTNLTFPVVPTQLVSAAVTAAGVTVPGSADLTDGQGTGYAMVEIRDCSGGVGSTVEGATAGVNPTALATFYPGDDQSLGATRESSVNGRFFAVGFSDFTATSSGSISVSAGVGVRRLNGTCTEEYGGVVLPVYADGITYLRANRETVIHADED